MAQISPVLRSLQDNGLMFYCPGCKRNHVIYCGQSKGPRWGWNGDVNKPSFSPSILVTWPANPKASEEFKEWRTERRCHSFIIDGQIKFLPDSTHDLKGQTVDMVKWSDLYPDDEE